MRAKRKLRLCTNAKYFLQCLLLSILYTCQASKIVIVGSINADTFLKVARLPIEGENLTLLPGTHPITDVPGGKGCTQAVAAANLCSDNSVCFVGQFGSDSDAQRQVLQDANVDISHCRIHTNLPSGRGYVFLTPNGQVSAVVCGGSNTDGWQDWKEAFETCIDSSTGEIIVQGHPILDDIDNILQDCQCVMLQREVPEYVNELIATCAKQRQDIMVVQDIGGEDRPISAQHLQNCDYIIPNESELQRLVHSLGGTDQSDIVSMARYLQQHHIAQNVLVTQGSRGCTLIPIDPQSDIIHQPALPVADIVDETGAGDAFRAAYVVALLERQQAPLLFASAAGACAVQKFGAVPSVPTRHQVEQAIQLAQAEARVLQIPRGDGIRGGDQSQQQNFPFLIGSRLNSMKDRPELWNGLLKNARDYVKRQATIKGLTCVDFNYPQHFGSDCWSSIEEAKQTLDEAGLVAGAVCLRFPAKFARGAMNHPDLQLRREAIDLTLQAAEVAQKLGCNEVVVWSAYDGYDYPFQVNYNDKWDELVLAFRECCDAFPDIKFSVEYKPTDENTRFFTIPSTGAALLMALQVDRNNFGLTLDVGHMLMSGENPGQSIAMAGRAGKLFGVQLNDGYTRLAAEDGLMFGSVHPSMALEIMYQLRQTNFQGHFYFDTFPQRTDPVLEAEYNIEKVKAYWHAAGRIEADEIQRINSEHDAIGALKLVDAALRSI